jgi:threonine aldolase
MPTALPIDLRSDTVTKPSPAMRAAMAAAEVGDDIFEDDPTVAQLERMAADRMGKEAGLFVPSGTMGNAVAIRTHTRSGDEILLDWDSHSMRYEVGGPAVVAGVLTRTFRSARGLPDLQEIRSGITPAGLHEPGTTLLVLENTHNRHGGVVLPLQVMADLRALAQQHHLRVHLDGARIFNAAAAAGVPAAQFAQHVDSVTFCLSKGLGCPAGSVLCGSSEFILRARRNRKLLGGGMRQVGILAAAGIYALANMVERLHEDHRRARLLAEAAQDLPGVSVDMETVQTNMVYLNTIRPAAEWRDALERHGVKTVAMDLHALRLVTHADIGDEHIGRAIEILRHTAEKELRQ